MQDPMQDQRPGQDIPYYSAPPLPGQVPYGMAPVLEQEEGWGKIGIAMVTLAILFAGGVAYFIATSSDEELAAAPAASAAVTTPADKDLAATDAAPAKVASIQTDDSTAAEDTRAALLGASAKLADAGAGSETETEGEGEANPEANAAANTQVATGPLRANGEVDRPAGLVSLSIESEPPGADVIRKDDGVVLGKTPYLYETESMPGSVQFVLQLDGYRSMSLSLPANKDAVRQVMLLPGKGGVVVPAPPTQDSATPKTSAKTTQSTPVKSPATSKSSDKRSDTAQPREKTAKDEPKSKPIERPKTKTGRVDYSADPIPLD